MDVAPHLRALSHLTKIVATLIPTVDQTFVIALLLIIGLTLIAVDFAITNDDHLSWVGFGFLGLAVLSMGGASLMTLAAAFPIAVFGSVFGVRKLVRSRPRPKSAHWFTELSGQTGRIIATEGENGCDGRIQIANHGEWRCRSSNSCSLSLGVPARVDGHDGLVLLVTTEGRSSSEPTGVA